MATLDQKEILLVQKFRRRVTDIVPPTHIKDDHWLIRWLRARDLDLEKAEAMLRKSMSWSRRNEMDSIIAWSPIHNYFRFATLGVDGDGSPVFVYPMGLWDMRELVEMGDLIPGVRAAIKLLAIMEDEIRKSAKRLNKPVNQVVCIFDCQQFSYRQLNSRTVCQGAIEFFKIFEANYPEILKHCYFVNTPRIFPIFFALLRPFLSARTMSKMEFFGPNKTKWTRAILSKIPSEILPPFYGGTLPGTDEYCTQTEIWNDGPLPRNYFGTDMSHGRNSISGMPNNESKKRSSLAGKHSTYDEDTESLELTMAEIPAGSKLELEFPVSKSQLEGGSTLLLKWKIKSEGYDIAFEVTFKDNFGTRTEVLIDNHRIESHLVHQIGSIVCDRAGTYITTFDNTYSKRRKKVILYNIVLEDLEAINN